MNAEIHIIHADDFKSFSDIHTWGESDIPENEYAEHSILLNLTKPVKKYVVRVLKGVLFSFGSYCQ